VGAGGAVRLGLVVIVGENEAAGQEGLNNPVPVVGRDEHKVRVVGRDEEDGHSREGEWGGEVDDAGPGIHAGADDGENGVRVLGDGYIREVLGRSREGPSNRGLKDGLGPELVADDGALDRRNADVEKDMLVVGRQALAGGWGGLVGACLGEENTEDGLEECCIERKGYMNQTKGSFLLCLSVIKTTRISTGKWRGPTMGRIKARYEDGGWGMEVGRGGLRGRIFGRSS